MARVKYIPPGHHCQPPGHHCQSHYWSCDSLLCFNHSVRIYYALFYNLCRAIQLLYSTGQKVSVRDRLSVSVSKWPLTPGSLTLTLTLGPRSPWLHLWPANLFSQHWWFVLHKLFLQATGWYTSNVLRASQVSIRGPWKQAHTVTGARCKQVIIFDSFKHLCKLKDYENKQTPLLRHVWCKQSPRHWNVLVSVKIMKHKKSTITSLTCGVSTVMATGCSIH